MTETNRILLRPLRIRDLLAVYVNIRNNEVSKWTGPPRKKCFENPVGRFICRTVERFWKAVEMAFNAVFRPKKQKVFRLAIVLKEVNKTIGIVSLSKQQPQDDCADIGFWIGKKYWGKGLMTEALKIAIQFGFQELKLNRINAWTFEKNIGSKRVMDKVGMRFMGVEKHAYVKYGKSRDRLDYSIQRVEFQDGVFDGQSGTSKQ